VVDHLIATPDDRDLKYAILHLTAAIEGFVKAPLPHARRSRICTEFDKPSFEAACRTGCLSQICGVSGLAGNADPAGLGGKNRQTQIRLPW
jgi:hypothetical protein